LILSAGTGASQVNRKNRYGGAKPTANLGLYLESFGSLLPTTSVITNAEIGRGFGPGILGLKAA